MCGTESVRGHVRVHCISSTIGSLDTTNVASNTFMPVDVLCADSTYVSSQPNARKGQLNSCRFMTGIACQAVDRALEHGVLCC